MKNTELFSKYQKDNVFLMFLFSKGKSLKFSTNEALKMARKPRVSVQGVKSLGGHFACLCRGFEFYEVKKIVIICQKENGNTSTLLIILIVKSLPKEQNSTNLPE